MKLPKIIITATGQAEQEEIEPQVQVEIDDVISDTESLVGDSPGVEGIGDDETEPQRGFMFGVIHWDANWIKDMDLYDDLDN